MKGYSDYNNKQQNDNKAYPQSEADSFLREGELQRGVKCASDVTGDFDVTLVRFSVGSHCAPATEEDIKKQPAVTAGAVTVPESVCQSVSNLFKQAVKDNGPDLQISTITGCLSRCYNRCSGTIGTSHCGSK